MKHGLLGRLCIGVSAAALLASAAAAEPLHYQDPDRINEIAVSAATPLPVNSTDTAITGTVAALNGTIIVSAQGKASVGVIITADTNVTFTPEGSVDGTNFVPIQAVPAAGGAAVSTLATTGTWIIPAGGYQKVELLATSVGATPTATATLNASAGANALAQLLAAQSANSGVVATVAATGANGQQLALAIDPKGGLITQSAGPVGTQVTGHSGDVAATAAVATLTATASTTAYIDGFQCYPFGATGASVILIAVTGTIGGTMTYPVAIPAGATTQLTPVQVAFPEPVAASAINTNIVVTMPSNGAGNLHASCNAQGHLF